MQQIAAQWNTLLKEKDGEHLRGCQRWNKDLQITKQKNISLRKSFKLKVRGCLRRMTGEDHTHLPCLQLVYSYTCTSSYCLRKNTVLVNPWSGMNAFLESLH